MNYNEAKDTIILPTLRELADEYSQEYITDISYKKYIKDIPNRPILDQISMLRTNKYNVTEIVCVFTEDYKQINVTQPDVLFSAKHFRLDDLNNDNLKEVIMKIFDPN